MKKLSFDAELSSDESTKKGTNGQIRGGELLQCNCGHVEIQATV